MQTLLIVEDDFDLNHAICLALEKEGYRVFSASYVESAKAVSYTHLTLPTNSLV